MRESIKAIKWCGLFSAIFLVATYLLTVNAEGQYISVDLIWISNSFLVTVFGGVFASMIVVFLCEIRKYLSTKSNTERFLFYQALYLYQALKQMEVMISDYLSQPERVISENLMDESIRIIQMEIGALEQTDYATFGKKGDTLMVEHGKFRLEVLPRIKPILQSGTRLKIALNETRIEILQNHMGTQCYSEANDKLTSAQSRIAKTLKDTLEMTTASEALVDQYIYTVDKYCNNRFRWNENKGKMVFPHIWELENKAYDSISNVT